MDPLTCRSADISTFHSLFNQKLSNLVNRRKINLVIFCERRMWSSNQTC
ncbi:Uncharacterised protein [Vibrio cholerae]|nr:Uncharacterised protein [Vibrio cholerae]